MQPAAHGMRPGRFPGNRSDLFLQYFVGPSIDQNHFNIGAAHDDGCAQHAQNHRVAEGGSFHEGDFFTFNHADFCEAFIACGGFENSGRFTGRKLAEAARGDFFHAAGLDLAPESQWSQAPWLRWLR